MTCCPFKTVDCGDVGDDVIHKDAASLDDIHDVKCRRESACCSVLRKDMGTDTISRRTTVYRACDDRHRAGNRAHTVSSSAGFHATLPYTTESRHPASNACCTAVVEPEYVSVPVKKLVRTPFKTMLEGEDSLMLPKEEDPEPDLNFRVPKPGDLR